MTPEPEPKRLKGTGVKLAYDTLRDEILSLALPPGALLDETTLAERFGMSRSPVREALIRLAGDELVVTLANRSTVVAPIDVQSFPRYVEALDIAQRMNTRLAAQFRTRICAPSRSGRPSLSQRCTTATIWRCPRPTNAFTWPLPKPGEIPT